MANWNTYIIGFEIKRDDDYHSRYNSLMKLINKASFKWTEPTSFIAIHVDETLSALASRLYTDSEVNSTKDVLVVVDTSTNKAKYYGPSSRKPTEYIFDLI